MKMINNLTRITIVLSIATLLFSIPVIAKDPQPLINNEALSQQPDLPREDVRRFVTAIATIHHYYIKDEKDGELFNDAIRGMVDTLDPHSSYLDSEDLKELNASVAGKFVGIGVELTLQEGMLKVISPLDDSPAEKAGIKPNDFILKVDGTLIRQIGLEEAIKRIKGEKGTKVSLTILRKDTEEPIQLSIIRDTINLVSVKSKLLEKNYGYVQISFFQGPVEKQLREALKQLKTKNKGKLSALVLDLRNNPGGLLDVSAAVADDFLDSKQLKKYHQNIVYTKGRAPGSDSEIKASPGDLIKDIPMVLLINGGSASASEIVAGALQDYGRAVILGTRSFGKGSVQTILPISDDSALKLTTALYYTPAGQVIQARGIIPDVTVPQLSIKDLDTKNFMLDEADFENHLLPGKVKKQAKDELEENETTLKSQLELAQSDYQLYQALITLKAMNTAEK
jgi:carboxyl-terminal processing protease